MGCIWPELETSGRWFEPLPIPFPKENVARRLLACDNFPQQLLVLAVRKTSVPESPGELHTAMDPKNKITWYRYLDIFSDCSNLLNYPSLSCFLYFSMVSSWFPCCFLARSSANQIRPDLWSDVIKPFQVVGGFDDASGLPGPKNGTRRVDTLSASKSTSWVRWCSRWIHNILISNKKKLTVWRQPFIGGLKSQHLWVGESLKIGWRNKSLPTT